MSRFDILVVTFVISLSAVTACWLYGLRHNNDLSLIDGYYGFASFVHAGLTYAFWPDRSTRGLLLTVLICLWALGFGQGLARRWYAHRGQGGDVRYRTAMEAFGLTGVWKSYAVAGPQALLIALLNLPIQLAIMSGAGGFRANDVIGLAVVAFGATMEVVANRQLELFKRTARSGATLMSGLWAWSRHPNYFGNVCVYTGAAIVAISDPGLWWTFVSPVVILITLRWGFMGTGVSGTDKLMLQKRAGDPVYLDYVARTPAFFPRPPGIRGRGRARSPGLSSITSAPKETGECRGRWESTNSAAE